MYFLPVDRLAVALLPILRPYHLVQSTATSRYQSAVRNLLLKRINHATFAVNLQIPLSPESSKEENSAHGTSIKFTA